MKIFWVFCCLAPLAAQDFLDRKIPLGNHHANQLYMEENYQEALKSYLDLYGQDTENGALAYNLGNTYAALGDMQKAEEYYQRANRLKNPEAGARSQFNLGNLQMQAQQFGDAVQSYADYLRNRPEDLDAKRNLELALRLLEQQQEQQQDQEQEEGQEQKEEESESSSSQDQEPQDQKDESPSQSEQEQNQENQPQPEDQKQQEQKEQEQKEQEQEEQPSEPKPQNESMDEDMKEQILQALKEQELEQQKEHQKRKIGRVKRRAKDW